MYFSSALARRYHVLRPSSSSWIRAASTTTPTAAAAAPTTTASLLPTTTPTAPPLDTATVQEVLSSTMQSTANTLHHPPNVVFDTVQQGLETLHAFTGLPWWCTLIGSTLLVRSSFLPLTLHQLRATARYATSAKPENDRLWSLVNKVTGTGADTATTLKAYQIYYQGMTSVLKKHRISLLSMFGGTLIQIPVFVTFVFTVRRMIRDPELAHELATGGALWFDNLTLADATMVLPLTAIGLTYMNLQVSLGNAPRDSWFYWFKDIGQCLLILALPITSTLPSGIFVYWTTSASFSAVQTHVLRADVTRTALGLPPIQTRQMPTPIATPKRTSDSL